MTVKIVANVARSTDEAKVQEATGTSFEGTMGKDSQTRVGKTKKELELEANKLAQELAEEIFEEGVKVDFVGENVDEPSSDDKNTETKTLKEEKIEAT